MFNYEKRLEYPVHITRTDPKAAMVIISQYGGLYSASLEIKITTYPVFRECPKVCVNLQTDVR